MTTTKTNHGAIRHVTYHAEKPFIKMPKVKLVKGMYVDKQGKKYIPELFDKFFKGVNKGIKPKHFKGELIGHNYL